MIFVCEHCQETVARGHKPGKKQRHCSYACKSAATRKIAKESLAEAVAAGMGIAEMARMFGSSTATVHKWLQVDGLMVAWHKRRHQRLAA